MGQMSTVSLEGGALTLVQSGRTRRHLLSEGSLHAAPWTARGYGNQGTVVFVRFDDGQVVTLAFEALLPDDRYAPDMASRADLYLDPPRAQALLDRLRPYIMPRDLDGVVTDSSYSILLHPRSKLGLPTQASRCLYVVGNTVALGEGSSRDLLARAEASDVETHAYVFEPRSPIPSCPCLRLRFPREDISIVVGASPMDPLARDWWGRAVPDGDSPTYLIGEVELVRLADTLGLSRGS
jgi:hypothetical protein